MYRKISTSRNLKPWFLFLLVVVATSFVATLRLKSPSELRLPPCPFRKATGLYCPGCGSTRALWRLLHGDLLGSLRYHPLVAPFLPIIGLLVVRFFRDSFSGSSPYRRSTLVLGFFCLGAFLILFVLRNIPCATFDFLRPPVGN